MKTPIVTLTTDWGERGFFAGMVKGALMRLIEGVQVVDVSHRLEAYNTMTASFVVRHACLGFPEGTVHIVDVDSKAPFVALRARGQYYLCSDNGLPAQVFGTEVEECVELPTKEGTIYNFAAYNLFVPAAARLLGGTPLRELGAAHPSLVQGMQTGYVKQDEYYRIYVQYIDDYGNAYLGMSYREFEELRQGRAFQLQVKELTVSEVSPSYYRHKEAERTLNRSRVNNDASLCLTVSATGWLELALLRRTLAPLTDLRVNESVLLRFK